MAISIAWIAGGVSARTPSEPAPGGAAAAHANDPAQWRRIALGRALDAAGAIDDPYRRAEAFTSIARVQMLIDDSRAADRSIHHALSAAGLVAEPAFRGWVLHDIVLARIAAEDRYGAREIAARIEPSRPRDAALAALAAFELRAGDIGQASAIAQEIREADAAGEVLRQIVAIQAARGELDAARQTLREIRDRSYRALALGDIAVAEVRGGRSQRATALAARASRSERSEVYGRIALARAQAGDFEGAAETMRKIDDHLYRAAVQGGIAARLAAAGSTDRARELFVAAIEAAERITDEPQRRARTFAQLARLQVASGERELARRTLQRAQLDADQLGRGEQRDKVLDYIARSDMLLGDARSALQVAASLDDRIARALLVRDVVTLQADVTAASALARVAAFDDPLVDTAAAFGVLGSQFLRSGRPGFGDTIDTARASVRRIDDAQLQPAAFAALAAARAATGDVEEGRSIFEEALAAADALEQPQRRAGACVRIVDALDARLLFLGQPAAGRDPRPPRY